MSDDCNVIFTEGFLAGGIISTFYFLVLYICRKQRTEEIVPPPYDQV